MGGQQFPRWAERFDFSDVVWLDKEVFLAPPQGEKRQLDLVAQLRIRPDAPPPWPGCTGLVVLIHIEVESGESVEPLRPRMFEYYVQLRRDSQLPVLPIGLYLRVGLDGIGWDCYEEFFWDHRLLRFEYGYVGLPALDAEQYASGENLVGAALSALIQSLLDKKEEYQEVRPLMITTFERGKQEGMLKGKLEGQLEMVLFQLDARFGPLAPEVGGRVAALSAEQLRRLSLDLLQAASLNELHLQD